MPDINDDPIPAAESSDQAPQQVTFKLADLPKAPAPAAQAPQPVTFKLSELPKAPASQPVTFKLSDLPKAPAQPQASAPSTPPPSLPNGLDYPDWAPGKELPEDDDIDFKTGTNTWPTPAQNQQAALYNRQLDAWKAKQNQASIPGTERTGLPGAPTPQLPGALNPNLTTPQQQYESLHGEGSSYTYDRFGDRVVKPELRQISDAPGILSGPFTGIPKVVEGFKKLSSVLKPVAGTNLGTMGEDLPDEARQLPAKDAGKQAAIAGTEIIGGAMEAAEPLAAAGGVVAPISTALTIGATMAVQKGAQFLLQKAGVDPAYANFAASVAGLLTAGEGGRRVLEKAYEAAGSPEIKFGQFDAPKPFRDMSDEELVAHANDIERNPPKNYEWQKQEIAKEALRRVAERGVPNAPPSDGSSPNLPVVQQVQPAENAPVNPSDNISPENSSSEPDADLPPVDPQAVAGIRALEQQLGRRPTVSEVQRNFRLGYGAAFRALAAAYPPAKDATQPAGNPTETVGSATETVGSATETQRSVNPTQNVTPAEQPSAPGEPGWLGYIPTSSINVDPVRFQFKTNVGQGGVGDELKDVNKWDPDKAGTLLVWRDPANGKTFVINGHHRVELAQRLNVPNMAVRYISAQNAQEARVKGALANIAEGRGESLDAAKVFRDTGMTPQGLAENGVSIKGRVANEGLALSKLAQPIFSDVVNGDLTPARGAVIGAGLDNHVDQVNLYELLKQREANGKRLTNDQVEELINLAKAAPTKTESSEDEGQFGLFGPETVTRSLLPEKAEVSDYVRKQLATEKKLFGTVSTQAAAEKLGETGNVIQTGENAKTAERANQGIVLYDKLRTAAGPISNALDQAAQALADGESPNDVKQRAYKRIRQHLRDQIDQLTGVSTGVSSGPPPLGGGGSDQAGPGQRNPADTQPGPESGEVEEPEPIRGLAERPDEEGLQPAETLTYSDKKHQRDNITVRVWRDPAKGWTIRGDWNLQGMAGGHLGDSGYNVWHPSREAAMRAFLQSAIRTGHGPQYDLDNRTSKPEVQARAQRMKDWLEALGQKPAEPAGASSEAPKGLQPFNEFRKRPDATNVPKGSVLAINPDKETAESLQRFGKPELQVLAEVTGAPKSGTKEQIAARILNVWKLRTELKDATVESLESMPGKDLRRYLDELDLFKGGNKHSQAVSIINWRNKVRHDAKTLVAKGNWLNSIRRAVMDGETIPPEIAEDVKNRGSEWALEPEHAEKAEAPKEASQAAPAPPPPRSAAGAAGLDPNDIIEQLKKQLAEKEGKKAPGSAPEPPGRDEEREAIEKQFPKGARVQFQGAGGKAHKGEVYGIQDHGTYGPQRFSVTVRTGGQLVNVYPKGNNITVTAAPPPKAGRPAKKGSPANPYAPGDRVEVNLHDGRSGHYGAIVSVNPTRGEYRVKVEGEDFERTVKAADVSEAGPNAPKPRDVFSLDQHVIVTAPDGTDRRAVVVQTGLKVKGWPGGIRVRYADGTEQSVPTYEDRVRPESPPSNAGWNESPLTDRDIREVAQAHVDALQSELRATEAQKKPVYQHLLVFANDAQRFLDKYGKDLRRLDGSQEAKLRGILLGVRDRMAAPSALEPPKPANPFSSAADDARKKLRDKMRKAQGEQYARDLTVPRDWSRPAHREHLYSEAEWEALPAQGGRRPARIRLNRQAAIALGEANGGRYFSGLHVPPERRAAMAALLLDHAEDLHAAGQISFATLEKISAFARDIRGHQGSRSLVLYRADHTRSLRERAADLIEEFTHWMQRSEPRISTETANAVAAHPAFAAVRSALRPAYGSDARTLVEEMGAKLAAGKYAELGVSRVEALSLLAHYYSHLAASLGPEAAHRTLRYTDRGLRSDLHGILQRNNSDPGSPGPAPGADAGPEALSRLAERRGGGAEGGVRKDVPAEQFASYSDSARPTGAVGRRPLNPDEQAELQENLASLASIGLEHAANGAKSYAEWSQRVMADVGDVVNWIAESTEMQPDEVLREVHGYVHAATQGTDYEVEPPPPPKAPEPPKPEPPANKPAAPAEQQQPGGARALIDAVYNKLKAGESLGNAPEFFKLAEQHFGASRTSGVWTPKDAFDAMEAGINKWILDHPELMTMDPVEAIGELKKLMERVASQASVRTQEQIDRQQFSTPPPEAYLVVRVAGVHPGDIALEPSAGNGGIAAFAKLAGATVHTNEISDRRRDMLDAIGLGPATAHDGELLNVRLDESVKPTVVVMNPPFSSSDQKAGGVVDKRTKYGFNHVDQALQRLAPGGRLVVILGGGRSDDVEGGASLVTGPSGKWFDRIAKMYNVRANVRIAGKEYQKYGTAFATRIIVIDKTGPTPGRPVNWDSVVRGNVDTIEEAYNLLQNVAADRTQAQPDARGDNGLGQGDAGSGDAPNSGDDSGRPPGTPSGGEGSGGPVQPQGDAGQAATGLVGNEPDVNDQSSGAAESGSQPAGHSEPASPENPESSPRDVDVQPGLQLDAAVPEEAPPPEPDDQNPYVPYRPTLAGPEHPGNIVETRTMATVPLPPITYRPNLPPEVLSEGRISAVQLEAVAIAGQQNSIVMPNGARSTALIGDGTGVGKGRIAATILWDNYRQGRKRVVWVSEKWDLMQDAIRDLRGIGATDLLRGVNQDAKGKNILLPGAAVKPFDKVKYGAKIDHDGMLFTTYGTVRAQSRQNQRRIDQLIEWLRGDDDGEGAYIVFDEAHNLKNAAVGGRAQSIVGARVLELLRALPRLRTVSLSATAATDVRNLGYLDRLGLWGPGTAFPGGFTEFQREMAPGGLAAMEMVARNLKAQGKYLSRTLSYEGVTYDTVKHELNEDQKNIYRTAAQAWQAVLEHAQNTIEHVTNGGTRQRNDFLTQLGGAQQRFFNLLITALKVPTCIELANQALDDDKAVVITFVNTNEAAQDREKAKGSDTDDEDEPPDYDFGPKELLINLILQHYPIAQWKDDVDGDGNPIKVPVLKPDGTPEINPAAKSARDALIARIERDLHLPENPLDSLVNALGGDKKVAEITGRKEKWDRSTGKWVKRGDKDAPRDQVNLYEMRAFQNGDKLVALLSNAGGTGISLHAGNDVKNQRKRFHITLQVGWSADKAMQMLGRTHRTNQAQPPEYTFLVSDVAGEQRFVSTIARRLGSLGALSRGQGNALSGGGIAADANLETEQGQQAAASFYAHMLQDLPIPGTDLNGLQLLSDMRVLRMSATGVNVPQADRTNVPKLLNRLLALDTDVQNPAYNYFFDIFNAAVQQAIEDGTLDTGVRTLPGDTIRVKETRPLSKDPRTGAEVFYYPVDAQIKTDRVSPEHLVERMQRNEAAGRHPAIIRHAESGRLLLITDAPPIVRLSGAVEPALYYASPENGRWTKIPQSEMQRKGYIEFGQWAQRNLNQAREDVRTAEWNLSYAERGAQEKLDRARYGMVSKAESDVLTAQHALRKLDEPKPPMGAVEFRGGIYQVLYNGPTRRGPRAKVIQLQYRDGRWEKAPGAVEQWTDPYNLKDASWTAPTYEDRVAAHRRVEESQRAAEQAKQEARSYQLPADDPALAAIETRRAELEEAKQKLAPLEAARENPQAQAIEEWRKAYEAAPTHQTVQHHLIGGDVMRFWNAVRDAAGNLRNSIYTTADSETGQRVVGVDIPQPQIRQLLDRITGGRSTVDTRQIYSDVMQNNMTYTLEGGIQVRRGRVGREYVVQLIPPNQNVGAQLRGMGVIHEAGLQPVYYVPNRFDGPADGQTQAIIDRVLQRYPAQVDTRPDSGPTMHSRALPGDAGETGVHGPVLRQFYHKPAEAIAWLLEHQTGDAVGALYHPDPRLGDVDLIWGRPGTPERNYEDGEGIAKLVAKGRESILADLPQFFPRMRVDEKRSGPNRIRLFDDRHKAAVRLDYDGQAKKWLLTVYEEPLTPGRTTSVPETPRTGIGETPSPDSGSTSTVASADSEVNEGEDPTMHSRALPGDQPLWDPDEEETSQQNAQRYDDKLLGDRLTAQVRSGMAMKPPKLKPKQDRGVDSMFGDEDPEQTSLFARRANPDQLALFDQLSTSVDTLKAPARPRVTAFQVDPAKLPRLNDAPHYGPESTPQEIRAYFDAAASQPGKLGKRPALFVNNAAMDALLRGMGPMGAGASSMHTLGMTVMPIDWNRVLVEARLLSQKPTLRSVEHSIIRTAEAIRHALGIPEESGGAGFNEPLIVVQTDPRIPATLLKRTAEEEYDHATQIDLPNGYKSLPLHLIDTEEGAIAQRALARAGYPPPIPGTPFYDYNRVIVAAETSVRLMRPGRWRELGLTAQQARDLTQAYIEALAQLGPAADKIIEQLHETIAETEAVIRRRSGSLQAQNEKTGQVAPAKPRGPPETAQRNVSGDQAKEVGPSLQARVPFSPAAKTPQTEPVDYQSKLGKAKDKYVRNLSQLENVSEKAHAGAVRAATSRAQASALIRAAVPRINDALGKDGPSWLDFRRALIESRLRGLRDRWNRFADDAANTSDFDFRGDFEKWIADALGHIHEVEPPILSGNVLPGPPQPPAETAAALVGRGDYAGARAFTHQAFTEAADRVARMMDDAEFGRITTNPGFARGLAVYKELLEKPMAESHESNEGIFSDALGPLDTYYPLAPVTKEDLAAARKGSGPSGRRVPYRTPHNIANNFATGHSEAYDPRMEPFVAHLRENFRVNNKAALLQTMQDQGVLQPLKPGQRPPDVIVIRGIPYKAAKVEIKADRTIVSREERGYSVTHAPARFAVIPACLERELAPILDRRSADLVDPSRIMAAITKYTLAGPLDASIHAANLMGTLVANTPFLGESLAGKIAGGNPLTKRFAALFMTLMTDPTTEEAAAEIREMAQLGLIPEKYGSVTYSRRHAELTDAELNRRSFAPALYGPKGIDIRARLLMYRLAKRINPDATPKELYLFVNQLGNYTRTLQGEIERKVKDSGWSPFYTAGSTMVRNGVNAWTGRGPLPKDSKTLRWLRMLSGGAVGMLALWALLHKIYRDEWPWEDPHGKFLSIRLKPEDRGGWLARSLYGDPAKGDAYVGLGFFSPIVERGARALFGLEGAYNTYKAGGSWDQIFDSMLASAVNSATEPIFGPPSRALWIGLMSDQPSLTGLRDDRGKLGPQFVPLVKTQPPGAAGWAKQHIGAPLLTMNGFVANFGAATGLTTGLMDPAVQDDKVNQWLRMAVDLGFPKIAPVPGDFMRHAEFLARQRMNEAAAPKLELKKQLTDALRDRDAGKARELVEAGRKAGIEITPQDIIAARKQAAVPASIAQFKSLPLNAAVEAMQSVSPEERRLFLPPLVVKLRNAWPKMGAAERDAIREGLDAAHVTNEELRAAR